MRTAGVVQARQHSFKTLLWHLIDRPRSASHETTAIQVYYSLMQFGEQRNHILNEQSALLENLYLPKKNRKYSKYLESSTPAFIRKLNTLTLANIRIEKSLTPLALLEDTPLVQAIEPIAKQARNFDPPNGQRGYMYPKQQIFLPLLTELSVATEEIQRESKLQSCLRNPSAIWQKPVSLQTVF